MISRLTSAPISGGTVFALVAVAAFIIAAFAADGNALFGWPTLTWISIGLAAWVLDGVFSIPVRRR
jgi:hypothetical protein